MADFETRLRVFQTENNIFAPTLESFDKAKHRYYRVASVASPFREQVIWAHMINSCRPGMPVRDTIDWAKGILTS